MGEDNDQGADAMLDALRDWLREDVQQLRLRKTDAASLDAIRKEEEQCITAARPAGLPDERIGLALSGGGIRSATFCLGVLQTLAREKRLGSIDYLSTVSGGGYIGSWLSAWIRRRNLKEVEDALARTQPSAIGTAVETDEPVEITRLRKLSNYLAPKFALLSLDSLAVFATWLRNVLLNVVLLFATASAALMIPRLVIELPEEASDYATGVGAFALSLAIVVLVAIGYNLWQQERRSQGWLTSQPGVFWVVVAPTMLAAFLASVWMVSSPPGGVPRAFTVIGVALILFLVLPAIAIARFMHHIEWSKILWATFAYGIALAVALSVELALLHALHKLWDADPSALETDALAAVITLGPAAIILCFAIGTKLFIGLTGGQYQERSREWWSRLTAWLLAFAMGWLLLFALALYVPAIVTKGWAEAPGWLATALGSGWIGSAIVAMVGARSQPKSPLGGAILRRAVQVAAIFFSIGLVLALSWFSNWVLLKSAGIKPLAVERVVTDRSFAIEVRDKDANIESKVEQEARKVAPLRAYIGAGIDDLEVLRSEYIKDIDIGPWTVTLTHTGAAFLALLAAMLLLSLRIDINIFSLHNLYKNRLVRCYLGASNPRRCAARFIGFDDDDDLLLDELKAQRPLHLINAALNITYGRNLAWQERMAAPFTFSGLHCGTTLPASQGDDSSTVDQAQRSAYRSSSTYGSTGTEKDKFTLGMALTTSGAAVSPARGPGTSPAVAFLLTLFNGRLGRWSPNPFQKAWKRSSPRMSIAPLVQELFGFADERRRFVYLSDGGFFDNLGIYELVRRECKLIIAVDASADPERGFSDLGEAIRKCRIDLGVEITFADLRQLESKDEEHRADEGFAKAEIDYGAAGKGVLLYVKPTLRVQGGEPNDVLAYAAQNRTFPHQTTVDQFFSESQFESYRKLGAFIMDRCLRRHGTDVPQVTLPPAAPVAPAAVPPVPDPVEQVARTARKSMWVCAAAFVSLIAALCAISHMGLDSKCPPPPEVLLTSRSLAAQAFLWVDFFVIVFYTVFFLSGYRVITVRLFERPGVRLRMLALAVCVLVALAGAAADQMENLVAFANLSSTPAQAAEAAKTIAPFTAAKIWLFGLNSVLLLIGAGAVFLAKRRKSTP